MAYNQPHSSNKEKKTAEVVDLKEFAFRKSLLKAIKEEVKGLPSDTRREFTIAITVVRYFYTYMPNKPENEYDLCAFDVKTSEIFDHKPHVFLAAFFDLMKFWEIEISDEELKCFHDNEFQLFPTIESICDYIEGRVPKAALN